MNGISSSQLSAISYEINKLENSGRVQDVNIRHLGFSREYRFLLKADG
jgi:hypothetical protein